MSQQRSRVLERISALPEELLTELESSLDEIEGRQDGVYILTPGEREAIQRGVAAADRGEFATDDEIAALLGRHKK